MAKKKVTITVRNFDSATWKSFQKLVSTKGGGTAALLEDIIHEYLFSLGLDDLVITAEEELENLEEAARLSYAYERAMERGGITTRTPMETPEFKKLVEEELEKVKDVKFKNKHTK